MAVVLDGSLNDRMHQVYTWLIERGDLAAREYIERERDSIRHTFYLGLLDWQAGKQNAATAKWENVLDNINNVVYFARQQSISTQKTHRLHFRVLKDGGATIQTEAEEADPERAGRKLYPKIRCWSELVFALRIKSYRPSGC